MAWLSLGKGKGLLVGSAMVETGLGAARPAKAWPKRSGGLFKLLYRHVDCLGRKHSKFTPNKQVFYIHQGRRV